MTSYASTEVTVSRSQEQIRNVLRKHAAARINFGEDFATDGATIGVEFVHTNTLIRILAKIKTPTAGLVSTKMQRQRSGKTREQVVAELTEQEAKRMWRVLHWAIKVRMEAVEEGLESFEQAFLPHIVDPRSGRTLWDSVRGGIESGALKIDGAGLPALAAGAA